MVEGWQPRLRTGRRQCASGSGPAQVTVTVESATFPEDRVHFGINTGLGQPLVLDLPGSPQGQRGDGGPEPAEAVRVTAPASVHTERRVPPSP